VIAGVGMTASDRQKRIRTMAVKIGTFCVREVWTYRYFMKEKICSVVPLDRIWHYASAGNVI